MTTRFPGWASSKGDDDGTSSVVSEDAPSTARVRRTTFATMNTGMVDEAVDNVIRGQGIPAGEAGAYRATMARDVRGPVAHNYYSTKAAVARARMVGTMRKDLTIRYELADEDVKALERYAPEFRFKFDAAENHGHPMAAATRMVDHKLIRAKLPHGVPLSDVGGNPMVYMRSGERGVHVCGPVVDSKDPMRHKLRQMEARTMSADPTSKTGTVLLASAYLNADSEFVCCRKAQDCDVQTPIITSIHVYDIQMHDWPAIMEKKGAQVVEGCVLFSEQFYEQSSGVLGVSKARYEIDSKKNIFRMGFDRDASWWYTHDLDKYLLYGADQVMLNGSHTYSYKIVERRGDTLFFRILRMERNLGSKVREFSYNRPGVPVVRVQGFEMNRSTSYCSSALVAKEWTFPRSLWGEMVRQASEDFERGVMDFVKMYNHYRTISVRHTINAVLVMGGEQVSADDLVPLVVHACLAAAASVILGQRTTRAITDAELDRRALASQSTLAKMGSALVHLALAPLCAPLYPFHALTRYLREKHASTLEQWIVQWQPVATIATMPVEPLLTSAVAQDRASSVQLMQDAALKTSPLDHFAAVIAEPALADIVAKAYPHMEMPMPKAGGTDLGSPSFVKRVTSEAPPTTVVSEPPSYASKDPEVAAQLAAVRKAAIREHIEETNLQTRSLTYACEQAYKDVSTRGVPEVSRLRDLAELHFNPDMWQVINGVIVKSALGLGPEQFPYMAAYHPIPDPATGAVIRSVYAREWEPQDDGKTQGRKPQLSYVLDDETFNGWVFTFEGLTVFNGPEIVRAMELSLELPHDYVVRTHEGPPGCGKTYAIVQKVEEDGSDCIMCPVRESINDTREAVLRRYPTFFKPKLRIRTLDSYLVNHSADKATRNLRAVRLLADECYMAHAGKIYAVAALLGVREVEAYGDSKQIPHIPRVQAPKLHVRITGEASSNVWLTYRCPANAVAAWGSVYDWKVRSTSTEKGVLKEVSDARGIEIPEGCVMMCMYQADKKTIEKLYARDRDKIRIMTAHESEGKTFDHVWLHRFDARKRQDKRSLFDQEPHVLVAMSRHRKAFMYIRPAPLGDLVSAWIERGDNVRRTNAAAEIESAGVSKERL